MKIISIIVVLLTSIVSAFSQDSVSSRYGIPERALAKLAQEQNDKILRDAPILALSSAIIALDHSSELNKRLKDFIIGELESTRENVNGIETIARDYQFFTKMEDFRSKIKQSIVGSELDMMIPSSRSAFLKCVNLYKRDYMLKGIDENINAKTDRIAKRKLIKMSVKFKKGGVFDKSEILFLDNEGLAERFAVLEYMNEQVSSQNISKVTPVISLAELEKRKIVINAWRAYTMTAKKLGSAQVKIREGRALMSAKSSSNGFSSRGGYGLDASIDNSASNRRGEILVEEGNAILAEIEQAKANFENAVFNCLENATPILLHSKDGKSFEAVVLDYSNQRLTMINVSSKKVVRFEAKKHLAPDSVKLLELGKY